MAGSSLSRIQDSQYSGCLMVSCVLTTYMTAPSARDGFRGGDHEDKLKSGK
jgi:hypothetical protein